MLRPAHAKPCIPGLILLLSGWIPLAVVGGQDGGKKDDGKKDEGQKAVGAVSLDGLKERYESEKEKEAFERMPGIEAFGALRTRECVEFLTGLYAVEANGVVGGAITRTLGRIGTEDAAKALIQKGMPYFLDPVTPQGAPNSDALREERRFVFEAMEQALRSRFEPNAEEWLLKNALNPTIRKDAMAQELVLRAVATFNSKNRLPLLLTELPRLANTATQVALLDELREAGQKDASLATLAVALVKSPDASVQASAYELLAVVTPEKHRTHFLQGLKNKSWEVRVVSLDGLAAAGVKDLVKHASAMLRDVDPRVRVGAVDVLFRHGGPQAIEPLYKALDTTDGRLQDDIADALARLTGKNFGTISSQWESWWAQNKANYSARPPLTIEELAELKLQDSGKVTQSIPLYFGLRVLSNQTAFLVDCSESMNEVYVPAASEKKPTLSTAVEKTEQTQAGTVVKPGDKGGDKKKVRKKGEASRLDVAKKELGEVLSRLKEGQLFNIFRFDSMITDFARVAVPDASSKKSLPRLDAKVRTAARDFVEKSTAQGLTNLFAVLKEATSYSEVDTIYLLSDGAPTLGVTEHNELLKQIHRLNRRARVKINTISFHPNPAERELLKAVSLRNHGVYVER